MELILKKKPSEPLLLGAPRNVSLVRAKQSNEEPRLGADTPVTIPNTCLSVSGDGQTRFIFSSVGAKFLVMIVRLGWTQITPGSPSASTFGRLARLANDTCISRDEGLSCTVSQWKPSGNAVVSV